jgi:hypothetical protein
MDFQMGAFLALLQQIAGTSYNCQQLAALAAQYTCLPRPLIGYAVLALLQQIANNGGGGTSSPPQVFQEIGSPVGVIVPAASVKAAVYFDYSIAGSPGMWSYAAGDAAGAWTEVIAP